MIYQITYYRHDQKVTQTKPEKTFKYGMKKMYKQKSFRRRKAKVRSYRRKHLDLENHFFNFVFPEFEAENYSYEYKKNKLGRKLRTLYHQGY